MHRTKSRSLQRVVVIAAGSLLCVGIASVAQAGEVLRGPSVDPGMTAAQVRRITGLNIPDSCSSSYQNSRYAFKDEEIYFGTSGLVWRSTISYSANVKIRNEETFRRVIGGNICHSGDPPKIDFLPGYKMRRGNLLIGGENQQKGREPDLYLWEAEWEGEFSAELRIEDDLDHNATYTCSRVNKTYWLPEPEKGLCPSDLAICPRFSFGGISEGSTF